MRLHPSFPRYSPTLVSLLVAAEISKLHNNGLGPEEMTPAFITVPNDSWLRPQPNAFSPQFSQILPDSCILAVSALLGTDSYQNFCHKGQVQSS